MRSVARVLLLASRFLAIVAHLAGLGAGLLVATLGSAFVCFDSCPVPFIYFANQGPTTVGIMAPCIIVEAITLLLFLAYCAATRQPRRAILQTAVFVVVGVVGAVALNFFMLHGQASVPLTFDGYFADSGSLEAWVNQWGLALMVASGAWTCLLAYLQWGH